MPQEQPWVTIAVLGRPRGNRGELTAVSFTSKPERFQILREVFLFGDGTPFEVESAWQHRGHLILKFRNIDSISEAERWQGSEVRIPGSERLALGPGEFYQSDLVGCEVIEQDTGASLGIVTKWLDSGGSGLLEVEGALLVPFARSICVSIDTAGRKIVVNLPQGLKELNRA